MYSSKTLASSFSDSEGKEKDEGEAKSLKELSTKLHLSNNFVEIGDNVYVKSYEDAIKVLQNYTKYPEYYKKTGAKVTKQNIESGGFITKNKYSYATFNDLTDNEKKSFENYTYQNARFNYQMALANELLNEEDKLGNGKNLEKKAYIDSVKGTIQDNIKQIRAGLNEQLQLEAENHAYIRFLKKIGVEYGEHGDLESLLEKNIARLHSTYKKIHQYKVMLGKDMPIAFVSLHRQVAQNVRNASGEGNEEEEFDEEY